MSLQTEAKTSINSILQPILLLPLREERSDVHTLPCGTALQRSNRTRLFGWRHSHCQPVLYQGLDPQGQLGLAPQGQVLHPQLKKSDENMTYHKE